MRPESTGHEVHFCIFVSGVKSLLLRVELLEGWSVTWWYLSKHSLNHLASKKRDIAERNPKLRTLLTHLSRIY